MKRLYDLLFGDPKTAYARARANTAAADAGMSEALASLDGPNRFLFGSLLIGAAVRLAPDALGHGLNCGASGSGKSSALSLIVEGFAAAPAGARTLFSSSNSSSNDHAVGRFPPGFAIGSARVPPGARRCFQ